MCLRVWLCCVWALGVPTAAAGQSPEPTRVSIDWSQVSDQDVERCGLARLRAETIERLVDAGYAVVDRTGADGIAVRVASVTQGLRLEVRGGDLSRKETLSVGPACDATFALEVIARIAERVDEVASALPSPSPAPSPSDAAPPQDGRSVTPVSGSVGLGARIGTAPSLLVGAGFGLRLGLARVWSVGGQVELLGNAPHGVTVLEGSLLLRMGWQPSAQGLGLVLELGPLVHVASSDNRSFTQVDALLALGPQVRLGLLSAQLLGYGRLRRFDHRVGEVKAFDTGHLGVLVRVGGQLYGS